MALEAASFVFSVIQTVLTTLQTSQQLKQLFSMYGHSSELDSLVETVKTIHAVLLDADAKEALSHQEMSLVKQLKDVVYDADDLIDKFVTLATQHRQEEEEGSAFSEKVRILFSRLKKMLGRRPSFFKEVRILKKRLDSIANDVNMFCFKVNNEPIRRRREETCSHLYEKRIIGRKNELSEIVGRLIAIDEKGNDVSFLTIVGMGGMGKTALAQLLYHHWRIKKEFAHRWWVCVGDYDQQTLHVDGVLRKILDVATGHGNHDLTSKELLSNRLQNHLDGKRSLLILDDVWNEDRNEWLKLEEFLKKGGKGSWIVLTSRSKETARIVGNGRMYNLKGLSMENSWDLFEMEAFKDGKAKRQDYFEVGKQIVEKCVGVPLAIRVVGSLLYGQKIEKWRSLQNQGIGSIGNDNNGIKSILKFSYYHLDSPLKSCFSYCALFPKDYEIKKHMLIQLWMANGYVAELEDEGRSLEEIAEDYFLILLRRCFFQDVKRDEYGEIRSCKMHDLMHDFAQAVAGKGIQITDVPGNVSKNTRHLSLARDVREGCLTKTRIRTLLTSVSYGKKLYNHSTLANFVCLRALDLQGRSYKDRDNSLRAIGKLVHLRYLDLSYSLKSLMQLPKSVTKLCNLQTLKLNNCRALKELPEQFCNLVKLMVLEIKECPLMHMPLGMNKLTCLHTLTDFIVADGSLSGQVEDLGALPYLRGELEIRINKNARYVRKVGGEVGFLKNKENLKSIKIIWNYEAEQDNGEEELMEDLEPHPNVKKLELKNYRGVIIRWMREEHLCTSLPLLVEIHLFRCNRLRYLPSLAKLAYLKTISFEYCGGLEFMEDINNIYMKSSTSESEFFPSLEKLTLFCLPRLKGWWRGITGEDDNPLPSFPCLSELDIAYCPALECIPLCPTVKRLKLNRVNKRFQPVLKKRSTRSRDDDNGYQLSVKLIHNTGYLKSLPFEALGALVEMTIGGDEEAEIGEEVLRGCSSSLRQLTINNCPKLSNLSVNGVGVGSRRLTALVELRLEHLENGGSGDMPWSSVGTSLRCLTLKRLPKLVNLPKGMRHLTALQTLYIQGCRNLKTLPDWMGCLSSLKSLAIWDCPAIESIPEAMRELTSLRKLDILGSSEALKERCQKPNGLDWPKIKHIPYIEIDFDRIQ